MYLYTQNEVHITLVGQQLQPKQKDTTEIITYPTLYTAINMSGPCQRTFLPNFPFPLY